MLAMKLAALLMFVEEVLWESAKRLMAALGQLPLIRNVEARIRRLPPYGAAAVETMTQLGVLQALQPKWVQGDNIAQTYQFVFTENAQLGFVALSQVYADGKISQGSAWIVPSQLHSPLKQDALLLNPGKNNPAAAALMDYLKTDKAKGIISAFGYVVQ